MLSRRQSFVHCRGFLLRLRRISVMLELACRLLRRHGRLFVSRLGGLGLLIDAPGAILAAGNWEISGATNHECVGKGETKSRSTEECWSPAVGETELMLMGSSSIGIFLDRSITFQPRLHVTLECENVLTGCSVCDIRIATKQHHGRGFT